MRFCITHKLSACALAATAAFLSPSAASATSFQIGNVGLAQGLAGNIYNAGLNNGSEYAGVGVIYLQAAQQTFYTYCVDIFDWLAGNTAFAETPLISLTDITNAHPYTGAQVNSVITFLTNVNPLVGGSADRAAAAQLGIWEILNETSGTYDVAHGSLTQGSFSAGGGNLVGANYNAITQANSWLGNLTDGTWRAPAVGQGLMLLAPGAGNQPQVYVAARGFSPLVGSAVPEPASWMTMILGFGAVGWAVRRRRAVGGAVA